MFLRQTAAACILGLITCAACAQPPHIVYILADDLGWKDVGYHGGGAKTPNLDRLAREGARLEKFYTLPYSTPTRAALMTGRYPMRYGLQTLSILPSSQYGLSLEEKTLAQMLKDAGYRTAMLGKWQLGHSSKEFWPTRRGFDYFYGSFNGEVDYFRRTNQAGEPDWHRNEQKVAESGYSTTLVGRDAARLISSHDPARPLFLYLSFQAPQVPLQAPKEYLDAHGNVRDENRRTYYAMIGALDDAVGAVAAALQKKGMADNTVIVFHSDNGGALPNKYPTGDGDVKKPAADNGPYADGKGGLHEGSVRVVAFANWPGKIRPGVVAERIHVTDMYPTLAAVAGVTPDQKRPLDGINQWDTITAGKPSPRKEMLLAMEDSRGSLLKDNWKLIVYSRLPVRYELYNIQDDPSEEDNRADREPQRLQDMLARFNELAWEMAPSLYLEDAQKPHKNPLPFFFGENPVRP
ncbi:MAG TPA: arylsulfatase [Burkholderiales bacterium]|nr:arylsulfatase [Burkholderiales bacterium]